MHRFASWLGKQEIRTDQAAPVPLRRLSALLDHDIPPWRENELPPLGHWLFHLPETLQSALGTDGHPHRGEFMPPISLARRMWAGTRIRFLQSVPIGSALTRRSTIKKIDVKHTAFGERTLITIGHEVICDGDVAIEENQDIVYLGDAARGKERRAQAAIDLPAAQVTRRCFATPHLLFRFSALTFNAHRIHYDREYARTQEHYPGLVVHGPLLATLLMDHYLRQHPATFVTAAEFRARAPIFDGDCFDLSLSGNLTRADLWITGIDGEVKMTGRITC